MKSDKIKGTLLMLTATLLWGSSFVVTKGAVDSFPTFSLVAIRMILGGASLALISRKNLINTNKRVLAAGIFLGIFYAGGMMLQTFGVKYTSAGRSAFLTSAYCIIVPFLEWKALNNKPTVKSLSAALICVVGIGLVALTDELTVDFGDLLTLGGALCFGVTIAYTGLFVKKYDAGLLNMYQLLTAGVILCLIAVFTETIPSNVQPSTMLEILYLSIACTGIPLLLQSKAQRSIAPTVITLILGFEAVFASVLSSVIYKEAFTGRCLIGFAMILVSVFIGEIEFKKK